MSRPARIRLVATRYPHWGAHAGVGQFGRFLPSHGFRADYRLTADDDSGLPLPGAARRERLRRRLQQGGMAWYKLSDLAAELRGLAAAATGRADLVHFLDGEHGAQLLPGWLDRLPGRRVPVVASYHQPPALLPGLVDPSVVAQLAAVVVVSPTQAPFFEAHLPRERVVTILHGVDTDFFIPGAPPDDGVLRCVTVGHWLRDWEAMRRAAEALTAAAVELHVVTGGPTGLEDLPNVRHHRGLSDDALLALYRRCDVGLLPLTDSTANNSLLEMIACGLPLVTTGLEAVRAYVDESAALLLPEGNAGVAEAVLALRDDPLRRARMGRAARARADSLALPAVAAVYAALYRATLGLEEYSHLDRLASQLRRRHTHRS